VPLLAEKDDPSAALVLGLDHALGVLRDPALDVLALPIEGIQLPGGLHGEGGILAEEELHRERGVREAAGGVDPRPEAKRDVDRLHRLRRRDPGNLHEGPEPRAGGLL
jgi:hypothetical protein